MKLKSLPSKFKKLIIASSIVAVASCGGGSNEDVPPIFQLIGLLLSPSGLIAQKEPSTTDKMFAAVFGKQATAAIYRSGKAAKA